MSSILTCRRIRHGGVCECERLAGAIGCDPEVVSFEFCQRVLQHHWKLKCLHGSPEEAPRVPVVERWKDLGPPDPLKAILVSNVPEDG